MNRSEVAALAQRARRLEQKMLQCEPSIEELQRIVDLSAAMRATLPPGVWKPRKEELLLRARLQKDLDLLAQARATVPGWTPSPAEHLLRERLAAMGDQ